jgi:NAD(P)-dependent dehydrogenase (short-subunit alcohol dehydrogenase family)
MNARLEAAAEEIKEACKDAQKQFVAVLSVDVSDDAQVQREIARHVEEYVASLCFVMRYRVRDTNSLCVARDDVSAQGSAPWTCSSRARERRGPPTLTSSR